MTDCLAENGRRIQIIRQLSINNSIQFLGVPNQGRGSGLLFIFNLQARVEATGWVSANYSNKDWGGGIFNANIITNVAWSDSVDPLLAYLPRSSINPRAARHRVRDEFLRRRHQERLWCQYNWRNPLVNPWVHPQDDNRDGLVTK